MGFEVVQGINYCRSLMEFWFALFTNAVLSDIGYISLWDFFLIIIRIQISKLYHFFNVRFQHSIYLFWNDIDYVLGAFFKVEVCKNLQKELDLLLKRYMGTFKLSQ